MLIYFAWLACCAMTPFLIRPTPLSAHRLMTARILMSALIAAGLM
jgi:hypothetical protein